MTASKTSTHLDWQAVGDELISHFRNLLKLDTRNPPGNETQACEYLRGVLEAEGITCQILGPGPDRGTLIARLKGNGTATPLLLMSHTDVVAVEPEKWTHDPFAADIADGFIYGRGALDMKNMVAMELMTMLLLKRLNIPLKRDVIYMANADEETGGQQGAGWIARHHPELVQAEYALSEGGGNAQKINGLLYYGVQTAEKGSARFRLRAKGKPGHGSVPHDDNAIFKLAEVLYQLRNVRLPVHFTASMRAYITAVASAQPPDIAPLFRAVLDSEETADAAIDALPLEDSHKLELHALIRNTITPTMLKSGSQINVIPSEAEVFFDARTLPGWTTDMFLAELRPFLNDSVELEFVNPSPPLEADPASPLFDLITDVIREHAPEATVTPVLLTGGTDAKHIAPLGTKVYGFAPELYIEGFDGWSGIHGHDERIHIQALQWGIRVLYEVVERFVS